MARPETERLFQDSVPSVPVSSSATASQPDQTAVSFSSTYVESTLDESVWQTVKRDIVTIGRNLRFVLIPIKGKFSQQGSALRNWDLWGPLVFMLSLSIILSWNEKKASDVFALVFTELGLGAVILTVNVILLGGEIVFFQSLCLLGYCLFPINIAALVCAMVHLKVVRTLVLLAGLGWSSWAALPFVGQTVPEKRRALAIFPVLLMYASIGWLALVKS